jgi:hypothetical protein
MEAHGSFLDCPDDFASLKEFWHAMVTGLASSELTVANQQALAAEQFSEHGIIQQANLPC